MFGLFGSKQLDAKKVAKIAALASNPYAQPDVRMRELQRLMDDATPVAVAGALKRFGANANGAIADEEEKKWLENALVEAGEKVKTPLEHYIQTESRLTYVLRAYRSIVGLPEAAVFFVRVLHAYGPEDHRSVEAKLQLVLALEEALPEPGVLEGLVPFLKDHSDDVRWNVSGLFAKACAQNLCDLSLKERAAHVFKEVFLDETTSPRIMRAYGEFLLEQQVPLPSKTVLPEASKDMFSLSAQGFLKKR